MSRSAMPASGRPPTIGEIPTTGLRATASLSPSTARIGPIETTGLDGQITTASARSSASPTPGAGVATSTPSKRMALTSSRAPRSTQYSWKCRSISCPTETTSSRVSTGCSLIGRIVDTMSNRAATRAVTSDNPSPSARDRVRNRWVARSRSPSPNHAASGSKARSSSVARNVSSRRPHPRSRSNASPSQYVTESRSGHTRRPWTSRSSPVFTTAVTSAGGDGPHQTSQELPRADPTGECDDLHRSRA